MKEEDFKDVNKSWKSLRVLIYTGTVTVGIDFQPDNYDENFDTFIGVFQLGCSMATQFVQSMCRCRTFKDKEHLLYIQHNKASNIKPETAADAWDELDNAGRSLCVSNKENEGVYKIRSPIDITYRLNDQSQGLKFYLNA